MKKILIALMVALCCVSAAFAEENEISGTEVLLIAGGETPFVSMILPEGFALQEESSSEKYEGHRYKFENVEMGVVFYADCQIQNQLDQQNLLRKVKDPTNKIIIFDNFIIGDIPYLVYCGSRTNHMWIFLMLTEDGFSYRFDYYMPVGQGQDEPPEEALAILATLRLLDENGEPYPSD